MGPSPEGRHSESPLVAQGRHTLLNTICPLGSRRVEKKGPSTSIYPPPHIGCKYSPQAVLPAITEGGFLYSPLLLEDNVWAPLTHPRVDWIEGLISYLSLSASLFSERSSHSLQKRGHALFPFFPNYALIQDKELSPLPCSPP